VPAALAGFLALAGAMGIGRFAFTPVLPLMQQQSGLSLAAGGVLAAANYAGYLAGALACTLWRPRPVVLVRVGLAAVAVLTAAMALVPNFSGWVLLRFGAGFASAAVFVGVSLLTVAAGSYAGVGSGIALAGLLVLVVGQLAGSANAAWIALGALAAVLAAMAWRPTRERPPAPPRAPGPLPSSARPTPTATPRRLVFCYAALGLGYILPATFLPAAARDLVPDPAVFGWVWPIFGVAAAVSTLAAAPLLHRYGPLRVWALAHTVMAAGVLAPVARPGLPAVAVAAVAVGATFMVATLAAMRAAREVAPRATRLIAAMTTAFAVGQLVGPLLVRGDDLAAPSVLAAAVLIATAAALLLPHRLKGHRRDDPTHDAGHRPDAPAVARDDGPRPAGGRRGADRRPAQGGTRAVHPADAQPRAADPDTEGR
jgi:predicted MFS family arabinose efflux permease